MSPDEIIAEHTIRKERESFMKRLRGLFKKTEQLTRVGPLCHIEQKIWDQASGQFYLYRSTEDDFPSISQLQQSSPEKIAQLLGPNDFITDDDGSNNDNDDLDSSGEMRVLRKTMKNIRLKKQPRQITPPKKKVGRGGPRASVVRIPQPHFVKGMLSLKAQNHLGTRRPLPYKRSQMEKSAKHTAVPNEGKPETLGTEKIPWVLPPLPTLKSYDGIPQIFSRGVSNMVF